MNIYAPSDCFQFLYCIRMNLKFQEEQNLATALQVGNPDYPTQFSSLGKWVFLGKILLITGFAQPLKAATKIIQKFLLNLRTEPPSHPDR